MNLLFSVSDHPHNRINQAERRWIGPGYEERKLWVGLNVWTQWKRDTVATVVVMKTFLTIRNSHLWHINTVGVTEELNDGLLPDYWWSLYIANLIYCGLKQWGTLLDVMGPTCGGRHTWGGEEKCIPLTLGPTIESSVVVSQLIWLLALCENQSCVWFGANSNTRALTNPCAQAVAVWLTSTHHSPITFPGRAPTASKSVSHQHLVSAQYH